LAKEVVTEQQGGPASLDTSSSSPRSQGVLERLLLFHMVVIVLIAAQNIFIGLGSEDFQVDDYHALRLVDLPLGQYMREFDNFIGAIKIQFWVSHRLFGGAMAGYRVLPATLGVLNLILVLLCLRRFWPSSPYLALFVGWATVFNSQFLIFSWNSMVIFNEYILLSSVFFFCFLRLLSGPLPTGFAILFAVALGLAPWIHAGLMIPIAAGASLVVVLRFLEPGKPKLLRLAHTCRDLWSLAIVPVSFLAMLFHSRVATQFPKNKGLASYLGEYAFHSSGYSHDIWGALQFSRDRLSELFLELPKLHIYVPKSFLSGKIAWMLGNFWVLVAVALVLAAIISAFRRRYPPERRFVLGYIFLCVLAPLVLSLLDLYRINARYTLFLIVPLLVGAGLGLTDVLGGLHSFFARTGRECFGEKMGGRFHAWGQIAAAMLIMVVCAGLGSAHIATASSERLAARVKNDGFAEMLRQEASKDSADLVLIEGHTLMFVKDFAPALAVDHVPMGWIIYPDRIVTPPEDLIASVARPDSGVDRVLVLARHEFSQANYPGFAELFPSKLFWKQVLATSSNGYVVIEISRRNPGGRFVELVANGSFEDWTAGVPDAWKATAGSVSRTQEAAQGDSGVRFEPDGARLVATLSHPELRSMTALYVSVQGKTRDKHKLKFLVRARIRPEDPAAEVLSHTVSGKNWVSFRGTGDWETAENYIELPRGHQIDEVEINLLLWKGAQFPAIVDNISVHGMIP